MTPKVSICIPCYEMGGRGADYLKHSLDIIAQQDFRDFEVVVGDQSEDDAVAQVCAAHADIDVRHIWTRDRPRQASANINAAMDAARGAVIKILFQDDYLLGTDALGKIVAAFDDPHVHWCLSGTKCTLDGKTFTRSMHPHYAPQIHFGRNTVGSPSVLALRRAGAPRFDEDLIWLMDVDFFKQCELQFGPPTVISEHLVATRLHEGQVSSGIRGATIRRELNLMRQKHQASMGWRDWGHYGYSMLKSLKTL